METKKQIIKTAKVCYIITKVLYGLSCAACLIFTALAIALSCTHAVKSLTVAETAILFGTLALYAFMAIGLLWNVESIFRSVGEAQAPFGDRVSHYLKKTAVFIILLSVVPSLAGSIILRAVCPLTELVFPIEFCGIIAGIVLFLFGLFFKYGKELQKNDDETL
ncbi:MAG: hypothetical protein NC332_02855 [Firmicutes bacterium]|nr:hypothetical protein [Bacillota bacterium]